MMIAVTTEFGEDFGRFVYFKIENGKQLERETVFVAPGGRQALIRQLVGLEIDILLANRLHGDLEADLMESGIACITGMSGNSDQAVAAYLEGKW